MIPLRKLSRFFGISDRNPPPAAPRGGGGECHEAGKNLQLDPLVTQQDLARLGVAYQTGLSDELEQAIEDSLPQNNKLIFTGHTGCGKSTLLADLKFRMIATGRYFVVMFSIADTIERAAVDHVNILFSMALQLL